MLEKNLNIVGDVSENIPQLIHLAVINLLAALFVQLDMWHRRNSIEMDKPH